MGWKVTHGDAARSRERSRRNHRPDPGNCRPKTLLGCFTALSTSAYTPAHQETLPHLEPDPLALAWAIRVLGVSVLGTPASSSTLS